MWVVKLGGSLADCDDLSSWLDTIAIFGGGQIVIVPGGGPFADQVRRSQARWGFDDRAAHHMALLAMEQYAWMLAGLRPELKCSASLVEIREALSEGRVPVWLPSRLVGCAQDVPASWDLTSDSLAAWLANTLAAECLILIKSAQQTESIVSVDALADCGLVDPLFPAFVLDANYEIRFMGKKQHALLRKMLLGDEISGTEVAFVAARSALRM